MAASRSASVRAASGCRGGRHATTRTSAARAACHTRPASVARIPATRADCRPRAVLSGDVSTSRARTAARPAPASLRRHHAAPAVAGVRPALDRHRDRRGRARSSRSWPSACRSTTSPRSTFAVSLVGGFALVPMIVAGLWGGMIADAFDRKLVLIVSSVVGWASIFGLIAHRRRTTRRSRGDPRSGRSTCSRRSTPSPRRSRWRPGRRSRRACCPPTSSRRRARSPASRSGCRLTIGPALAGVLVAAVGFSWTYAVDARALHRRLPRGPARSPGSLRCTRRSDRACARSREGLALPAPRAEHPRGLPARPLRHGTRPAAGAVPGGRRDRHRRRSDHGRHPRPRRPRSAPSSPACSAVRSGRCATRAGRSRVSVMVYGGFVAMFGVTVAAMQTGWFGAVGADFARVNVVALVDRDARDGRDRAPRTT